MKFIGIDPGMNGALVVLNGNMVATFPFKKLDEKGISNIFDIFLPPEPCTAVLENVHSMPGQGVASSFKFGGSFGFLKGCLHSRSIPFELISPQRWQRDLECLTGGDKNVTKAKAQELFPKMKVTHAIADALLLAVYCRKLHENL